MVTLAGMEPRSNLIRELIGLLLVGLVSRLVAVPKLLLGWLLYMAASATVVRTVVGVRQSPPVRSSSMIVPTPWPSLMAALLTLLRFTQKVSLGSSIVSLWITTVIG